MTTAMWICAKCGQAYGRRPDGNPYGATWHIGDCDVCSAKDVEVTEPRDYGYLRETLDVEDAK